MLWYKSWLDTRWRFGIGLVVIVCGAWLAVLGYPRVTRLVAAAPAIDTTTEVGRRLQEIVELSRGFRGYVWTQWFRQTAVEIGTLLAVLLGSGSLLSHGGGELYTLSLPVSRRRLLAARATVGLAELFAITVVPSLLIAAAAPAVGEYYGAGAALVHAACLFIACAAFFSLALLLSTSYSDVWRPMLIALAAAFVVALAETGYRPFTPYSILRLMTGETYFRTGHVPWLGLGAAAALSAALISTAAINVERRDY
jgi:hypothetical protein